MSSRFPNFKVHRSRPHAALLLAALAASPVMAVTYYVSPTGSDQNAGTSASAPWGSVAKVDATSFQPGDQILFQYGSSWDASLDATSNGTTVAPIVYGAYGNSSLGNPTFMGSNPISSSSFTKAVGTTYTTTSTTPINWIFDNHQFTQEAQDATGSSDPATDANFVESTPGSFYYNTGNGQLFVNTGSAIAGQTITAAVRQDAIFNNGMSNLVFRNLNTSETAVDNGGYGIRAEGGSNVEVINSTVSLAGKHNVGVINNVGFNGINIVANGSAPDLGFGGASAVATYGDGNAATGLNNSSTFTNLTYLNPNGSYEVLYSHGGTNGVASIALNNVVSQNGYGTGIVVSSTGAGETVLINGGKLSANLVEVSTNNSVVNGLSGPGAVIQVDGTNDVVQNNLIYNSQPSVFAGANGSIIDNGTGNTVRFNTVSLESQAGPGLGIVNANASTNVYANIFTTSGTAPIAIWPLYNGTGALQSNQNLLRSDSVFGTGNAFDASFRTLQQWIASGYDTTSTIGNPVFTNAANGDYSLAPGSPGLGIYTGTLGSALTAANALVGSANSNGTYNAGLNPVLWPTIDSLQTGIVVNNGQVNTIAPASGTLTITAAGALLSGNTSTVNLTGSVANSGVFIALGGLIQSGNFNNSGTAVIGGFQLWTAGALFNNLAGSAIFQTDAGGNIAPTEELNVNVMAGFVTFGSTQHLSSLTVAAGASAMVTNSSNGRSILFTPSLSVSGRLDLTGNDLVVESGSLPLVTALIKSGYNLTGGGNWTGEGITSSTAATNTTHLTALGVILNSTDGTTPLYGSGAPLGLFDGTSPAATDVLVRYTYVGDANLDGKVDASDYARIDNGFLQHLTGWYNGDFNYDGVVNGSDYTLIDNAFNNQGAALTAQIATLIASNPASVPEPAALSLLTLSTAGLLARRRRQSTC